MKQHNHLTLGSLFDGSGGFPLGGLLSGITPLWASEIEPFPIRVTTRRIPQMQHLGDISKVKGSDIVPVDIITFGSPCTDMSIAGKRAGLEGKQSVLFYQAIRIIKEMRCKSNDRYPRFIIWENVPGAFSSNRGADFKEVLEAICKIKSEDVDVPEPENGKWANAGTILAEGFSLAWRVLDAQYFGIPQRRRRIYLVADFAGEGAGEILFESEGLSGYPPQSLKSWQRTAGTAENGTGAAVASLCLNDQGGNRMDVTNGITCTLRASSNHPPLVMDIPETISLEHHPTDSRIRIVPDNLIQTLTSRMGTGGNNVPLILEIEKKPEYRTGCVDVPKAFGICSVGSNSMKSTNPRSGFYKAITARTLDANGGNPSCNQGGIAVVAAPTYSASKGSFFMSAESELANTLMASDFKDPPIVNAVDGKDYIVRRLTPTECAKLQGFPDWWCDDLGEEEPSEAEICFWAEVFETHREIMGKSTRSKSRKQIIKWLRNPHSDSAEYKMWGNGVALPCVCFVLAGIVWAVSKEKDSQS